MAVAINFTALLLSIFGRCPAQRGATQRPTLQLAGQEDCTQLLHASQKTHREMAPPNVDLQS